MIGQYRYWAGRQGILSGLTETQNQRMHNTEFGIRIEDDIPVTKGGHRLLPIKRDLLYGGLWGCNPSGV